MYNKEAGFSRLFMTKKKKKPAPNIQKIAKAGGFLLVLLALLFGLSPVSRLWGLAYVAYFPLGISSFAFLVLAHFAEGIALHRQAVALRTRLLGDHEDTAFSLGNLGVALASGGEWQEAAATLEQAVAMYEKLGLGQS